MATEIDPIYLFARNIKYKKGSSEFPICDMFRLRIYSISRSIKIDQIYFVFFQYGLQTGYLLKLHIQFIRPCAKFAN